MDAVAIDDLEIQHCCLERGVKLEVKVEKPLDLVATKQNKNVSDYFESMYNGSGFFRFVLAGTITITGVIDAPTLTIMFSFFQKEKCVTALNEFFRGFRDFYEMNRDELK